MVKQWLWGGLLAIACLPLWAADTTSPVQHWTELDTSLDGQWLQLASSAASSMSEHNDALRPAATPDSEPAFRKRLFTANTLHKYLGIGSLGLAGLTVLAPKEEDEGGTTNVDDSLHANLARSAAALGAAAVLTGVLFHWEDLSFSQGFKNPDNVHALLTTVGTLGYFTAIDKAPAGGHSSFGVGGAISMAVGIKMTW